MHPPLVNIARSMIAVHNIQLMVSFHCATLRIYVSKCETNGKRKLQRNDTQILRFLFEWYSQTLLITRNCSVNNAEFRHNYHA